MHTTVMGNTEWKVPVQGLGCMRMGMRNGPSDDADAATVINRALDRGVRLLDTADLYGNGRNEEIVGRATRNRRDEVLLCTKFGVVAQPDDTWIARGDAAYVVQSCDASLRRLGADVIDLYYLHRRDNRVPIEETVGAMAELVAAGKVTHLGLSEVTGEELRAAHGVHPITAVQSEWSLCCREVENLVPLCADLNVGIVAYSPQGRGLLSRSDGTATNKLAAIAPHYTALPEILSSLARKHAATPGQVALAWVHSRSRVWDVAVTAIPGTTKRAHLDENIDSLAITLDADDLNRLDIRAVETRPEL